jgi:predicted nucleic acid-binding protein
MVGFDTNVLVYATAPVVDVKAVRARELIGRGMGAASTVLLLQTLAEFSNVAIRKAGIRVAEVRKILDAWLAVLPVQAADQSDLLEALDAVGAHRLAFWDAMLWASAKRAGIRYLLSEDFQDGFALHGVTFINPFTRRNDKLIDEILPLP